jgi:hypothetical protein
MAPTLLARTFPTNFANAAAWDRGRDRFGTQRPDRGSFRQSVPQNEYVF